MTLTTKVYTEEQGEYLKNNPTWHVEDSPWKAKQIIKLLDRNDIHPASIAEVGCGAGEILNQLYLAMGEEIRFTGYDISVDAIKLAKQRERKRLKFNRRDFLLTVDTFDLLLMIDVFEHVDDYLGFLRHCRNRAKHTIFHIPLDISAQGILRNKLIAGRKAVSHLHYFMKDTALATLTDSGYEILDYFYTASALELPNMSLKAKLASFPRKLTFSLNHDFAARVLGGYSLLVLTK